jgi:hypothetical protein
MGPFIVQFFCDPEYGGDGEYHDAIVAGSWLEASSLMGWEVDQGRPVRIMRHGKVLGDPAEVRSLAFYELQEHGFLPHVGLPIGGRLRMEVLAEQSHCRHSVCRICAEPSLEYRGFYRPGRHRGFSVCPTCGDALEVTDAERV